MDPVSHLKVEDEPDEMIMEEVTDYRANKKRSAPEEKQEEEKPTKANNSKFAPSPRTAKKQKKQHTVKHAGEEYRSKKGVRIM